MLGLAILAFALVTPEDACLRWLRERGGGSAVCTGVRNGVRGLILNRDAHVGDVLLEVPLSACVSDIGGDDDTPLAGAAPKWTAALPWNVQLALAVIARTANGDDPFLDTWPSEVGT